MGSLQLIHLKIEFNFIYTVIHAREETSTFCFWCSNVTEYYKGKGIVLISFDRAQTDHLLGNSVSFCLPLPCSFLVYIERTISSKQAFGCFKLDKKWPFNFYKLGNCKKLFIILKGTDKIVPSQYGRICCGIPWTNVKMLLFGFVILQ